MKELTNHQKVVSRNCSNCYFFNKRNNEELNAVCCRFPPIWKNTHSDFVGTRGDYLCGEYKKTISKKEEREILDNLMSYEDFEKFWDKYPRKDTKKKSMDKFLKIKKDLLPKILSALEIQVRSEKWSNKDYIPMPITYLNGERWNDDLCLYKSGGFKNSGDDIIKNGGLI